MAKFLRIAQWNANGLQQHKDEVTTFLTTNCIDIMLISETHFTARTFVKIPGYKIYHTDYPDGTAHGGAAVVIKQNIVHHELPNFKTDHIQATSIQVNKLPRPITVTALYCPPRHKISKNQFSQFFKTLGPTFMAGGDYNSKHTYWGSRLISPKGRELHKCMTENNYNFLSTGKPTYWPTDLNKVPDLLDFFVTHGISSNYSTIDALIL